MNSRNSKTSNRHELLLILSARLNLKRSDKYVIYQILVYTRHVKNKNVI